MALDVAPAADWRRWLECALSPMGMEEFFQDYLERQPLHLDRRGATHYAGLFSLAEMEALLFRGGAMLSARNMMVVRTPPADTAVNRHATEKLPVPDGAGESLPAWLRSVYAEGWSIMLMRVEQHSEAVARLAQAARLMFNAEASVNAYLSPPRAQGFSAHYDSHDTFILQVHGEKRWRLHGQWAHLPSAQGVGEDAAAMAQPRGRELPLRQGDLLYLPRGHAHEAASGAGASLHLTLGLYSRSWAEVFAALAAELGREHAALRARVPWPPEGGAVDAEQLEAALRGFRDALAGPQRLRDLLDAQRRRLLETSAPQLPLLAPPPLPALEDGTRLRRAVPCQVSADGERLRLSWPGGAFAAPARLGAALRFVAADCAGFAAAGLPGLDADSRRVLLTRLLQEGVLRPA